MKYITGIKQAKDRALIENQDLQIMIIKLPSLLIHSSNLNAEMLTPYLQNLPAKLPDSMWTYRKFIHNLQKLKYSLYIMLLLFQKCKVSHGH